MIHAMSSALLNTAHHGDIPMEASVPDPIGTHSPECPTLNALIPEHTPHTPKVPHTTRYPRPSGAPSPKMLHTPLGTQDLVVPQPPKLLHTPLVVQELVECPIPQTPHTNCPKSSGVPQDS
nr:PREDICTED: uncharacterized protein LOC105663056 [Megachile rotundata]